MRASRFPSSWYSQYSRKSRYCSLLCHAIARILVLFLRIGFKFDPNCVPKAFIVHIGVLTILCFTRTFLLNFLLLAFGENPSPIFRLAFGFKLIFQFLVAFVPLFHKLLVVIAGAKIIQIFC